jgi:hypothetical protein
MANVLLGLCCGIAFGFVIQRIGATDANRMAEAHLMRVPDIPQFMLAAVALSAVGLLGLQAVGLGNTLILPTSIVATGVGAVIFGIGWGISGYCPGTTWAAAGEGRMDALFALLGGFAGTAVFANFHEQLIPMLYVPTNLGPLTLADWLGSRSAAVIALVAGLSLCVMVIGKLWKGLEKAK